ncbi:glycosyltransferase family 2 protein [Scleroderma citrinum Foug A]|uniref:dolichyl-phosphate beta-glucosyltransferase n=1 Tax=Scleroderma citrinum Foug A TaxID=1036808 RepID=A0A0C2YLE6_9AGAM|nr:glycosyltransferase family 2 protein [Scleroderma citrinum Foug A]KIM50553.1 glycosyltransferase family 2 protein [Scleroderma citrinum Foug A]
MASQKPLPPPSLADPGSVELSVIIPAYNETNRLPSMLETTLTHLNSSVSNSLRTYEILIVDDRSKDDTSALALKLARQYAQSDIRGSLSRKTLAKGEHRFEDLEYLWAAMDEIAPQNEAAVAIGSRAHLVKTEVVVKRSLLRNILMYGLHAILRIVGVGHIRDTQWGFKLFTRPAAQKIFPAQYLATWIFDVELLLLAKQLSIPVAEAPIEWHEVAGSKLNIVKDSLQMLRDLMVLRGNWKLAFS